MPELPDVQVFKEYLDATALHQRIETVHLRVPEVLENVSESTLRRWLLGKALTGTRRHGKHLFVAIHGGDRWLRLHFGMTGWLRAWEDGDEPEFTALRLDFGDGSRFAYLTRRKLGAIGLVPDPDDFVEQNELGPDPLLLDFDEQRLRDALGRSRGTIKRTLMNQSVIAGLGNVYSDEILFHAGIHPKTPIRDLDDEGIEEVLGAMRHVVRKAIEAGADPDRMPRTWLLPHREEGAECPRCGGQIERIKVSGRGSYLCPDHQPRSSRRGS